MLMRSIHLLLMLTLRCVLLISTLAQESDQGSDQVITRSASASAEAIQAAAAMNLKEGFELHIHASEPLLANPVSLDFDAAGRCFVVESHRRRTSVYDIRRFPEWLDSDFGFQRVADRSAFLKEQLTSGNPSIPKSFIVDRNRDGLFDWHDLEVESERIVLLEDPEGKGYATQSKVFASGFQSLVSGVAAGVLARGKEVWFTCIPDLWRLEDSDQDGQADSRERLHTGFGVHIAFGGHDMHGLIMGPDGRLYFSIADRGAHVEVDGQTVIDQPHTGSVFRCEPDGSELTLFATGLRNPQELAFDAEGNLWTVDNNGDGGDKARLVYVVEGGDSGWTMGWQWLPNMGSWNSERLWETAETNTGQHLIPPIAHVGHGPAGLAFYPGTGLPEGFENHFFLCDFPGGVRHFKVHPKGAGFEVRHSQQYLESNRGDFMEGKLLWGLSPVDLTFGPRPGVYVADWIQGWEKTGKGRIFRIAAKGADEASLQAVNQLLQGGLEGQTIKELGRLLGHRDQRIRQEAQFELVRRYQPKANSVAQVITGAFQLSALDELSRIATEGESLKARTHAIWGLGQLATRESEIAKTLTGLLKDPNQQVVQQALRVLADRQLVGYYTDYQLLIQSPNERTRFFALKWLWKTLDKGFNEVQHSASTQSLVPLGQSTLALDCLRRNEPEDPYIRHAAVRALIAIADFKALAEAAKHPNRRVRIGAILALRALARPEVAAFLEDSDPAVVTEAARAIHDRPIDAAQSSLAQLVERPDLPEAAMLRAVNAQYRLGQTENAAYLISLAQDERAPESMRAVALRTLAKWPDPPARDAITGLTRTLGQRDARSAAVPLRLALGNLSRQAPEAVLAACLDSMTALDLSEEDAMLLQWLTQRPLGEALQISIIQTLAEWESKLLPQALLWAREKASGDVLNQVAPLQAKLSPEEAIGLFAVDLRHGSIPAKQAAMAGLAALNTEEAWTQLEDLFASLENGTLPSELLLECLELAKSSSRPNVSRAYQAWMQQHRPAQGETDHQEVLYGGSAQRGRRLYMERQDLGCMRCHGIDASQSQIGPSLIDRETPLDRTDILESILTPNKAIAQGHESVHLELADGTSLSGILQSTSAEGWILLTPDGQAQEIDPAQVEERRSGLSLMPEGLAEMMTPRELRDLIEFLANPKP